MRDFRIAAGMMRSVVGDKAGNLLRVRTLAAEAAAGGAEVLVLPEACLTGYTVRESLAPLAEPVPGPLTEAVQKSAAEFGLTILAGLLESVPSGPCYLTQVMIGPEGVIGSYRKTHLGPTEKTLFAAGDSLRVIAWDQGQVKFGLQLCYEGHFPEISLSQARMGAEVILISHASPREGPQDKLERWRRYLPARAYDNTVFMAAVNQVGHNGQGLTFAGVAMIVDPKGDILAQAAGDEEALIFADLCGRDLEEIRQGRMGYFLPWRRPDLYRLD
ncbi:MAG: nitrilase-related carbon-nitrogen hydrolase [Pseudomonadota bacterium]